MLPLDKEYRFRPGGDDNVFQKEVWRDDTEQEQVLDEVPVTAHTHRWGGYRHFGRINICEDLVEKEGLNPGRAIFLLPGGIFFIGNLPGDGTPRLMARIHDAPRWTPMITTKARRAASIPWTNASETPPTRLVVPIKTWNATSRGIEAAETVMAITKLPKTPIFCTVRRMPISRRRIPAERLP